MSLVKTSNPRLLPQFCATLLIPCLFFVGCQKNNTAEVQPTHEASEPADHDHDEHADHEHDEHDDHEHADHDEHDDHEHDEHEHDDHEGHHHDDNRIAFSCEPEQQIKVFYHDDATPKTAHLLIEGIEYDLTQVPASSGTKFETDIGLTEDKGLSWTVTDNNAVLSTLSLDKTDTAEGDVLYRCQQE